MTEVLTYWNGEPTPCRKVWIIMADSPSAPRFWGKDFVGQRRKAVEVNYRPGHPDYLDDETGDGWGKVMDGGSPWVGHRNCYPVPGSVVPRD